MNQPIDFDVIKNQSVKELLERLLEKNPAHRATLDELLATAWVTNNWTESVRLHEV